MATAKGGKSRNAASRQIREIHRRCKVDAIQLVRFLYCGNDGVIRGKACHTKFLDSYLTSGIGLTVAMQSFNMTEKSF
jgi:Glutamine synthetase N-terminal domain